MSWWGSDPATLTPEERQIVVLAWRDSETALLRLVREDALKEFHPSTRRTLGTPDTNPFIKSIDERIDDVTNRASILLEQLSATDQ